MSEIKEEIKSGLTARAFITGLIFVIAWTAYGTFAACTQPEYSLAAIQCDAYSTQSGLLAIFALSVVSSVALGKMGFTPGELTIVYTMMMSTIAHAMGTAGSGFTPTHEVFLRLSSANYEDVIAKQPSFWVPSRQALEPMLMGGAVVPWSEWIVPLTYWGLFTLSFFFTNMFLSLILSHRMILEDRLPFPFTQVVAETFDISNPEKPPKERSNIKIIGIFAVIGFLFQSTYGLLQILVPSIPPIWNIGWGGVYYYDPGPLIGPAISNMWVLISTANLLSYIALWFLTPTRVLFSIMVAFFLWYWIVPAVEVQFGLVPNVAGLGLYDVLPGFVAQWGTLGGAWGTSGLQIFLITLLGVPLGAAIAYIVLYGNSIGASFKSALAGGKTGPFSSRIIWVGFIVSFGLFVVLTAIVDIPIAAVLLYLAMALLLAQLGNRLRGESPRYGYDCWHVIGTTAMLMPVAGPFESAQAYRTMSMNNTLFNVPEAKSFYMLEGLRLAEITKTSWAGVVIASVVGFVVSLVVYWTIYIWGAYTYGFQVKWPAQYFVPLGDNAQLYGYNPSIGLYTYNPEMVQWGTVAIGLVLGLVLTFLSFWFPRFPINSVGFVIGGMTPWVFTFWFQALVALILKFVVLRVGGSQLYAKRAIPIATGIIVGSALCTVVYGIIHAAQTLAL